MNTTRFFTLLCVFTLLLSLYGCGVSQEPAVDTIPVVTEAKLSAEPTLPFQETVDPAAETTEAVTEPTQEQTVPTETVAETAPDQPAETQPPAAKPKETQPPAAEPKETQPPATEPQPSIPKENPYINAAGQTVYYSSGGTLVFGKDKDGNSYCYVTPAKEFVFDVTPANIRASDWNSWDPDTHVAFENCFPRSRMSREELHNFLKATQFDDYDCGYEGHACRYEADHQELMENLATPCRYCGETNCVSWLALDPETLFTKYDPETCPKYDETKDPFFYCQVCHKNKWGKPSESCNQYLGDVNCYTCGEPVKAHACHTCAFDEDIYDEYKNEFTAPRPTTPAPTAPEPTTPAPDPAVNPGEG